MIFGATGMVGQGVLRACLRDPDVTEVLAVGRSAVAQKHDKLRELVMPDPSALGAFAERLATFDACFYCLGISSTGLSEADYRKVTYDMTLDAARALVARAPGMTFVFVSGAGSSATSRMMWARVKAETEDALLALPFRAAYVVRPGFIQPLDGIRSRTRAYNALYAVIRPVVPLLKRIAPRQVITTDVIGRAMIEVGKHGAFKRVLGNADLNAIVDALPNQA
jgi:uncharacterized protein YbjT (DUF2867 family)